MGIWIQVKPGIIMVNECGCLMFGFHSVSWIPVALSRIQALTMIIPDTGLALEQLLKIQTEHTQIGHILDRCVKYSNAPTIRIIDTLNFKRPIFRSYLYWFLLSCNLSKFNSLHVFHINYPYNVTFKITCSLSTIFVWLLPFYELWNSCPVPCL